MGFLTIGEKCVFNPSLFITDIFFSSDRRIVFKNKKISRKGKTVYKFSNKDG